MDISKLITVIKKMKKSESPRQKINKITEMSQISLQNDSFNVQLIVKFIMRFLGSRSGRLEPHETCSLKINVETVIIHFIEDIRLQMQHFFKQNWKQGYKEKDFQVIIHYACGSMVNFKKYSAVEFLQYCSRVCLLASFAFDKERKAPRVAMEYISEVLQKYRLEKQFTDHKWTYMNGVIFHYLIDNDILP